MFPYVATYEHTIAHPRQECRRKGYWLITVFQPVSPGGKSDNDIPDSSLLFFGRRFRPDCIERECPLNLTCGDEATLEPDSVGEGNDIVVTGPDAVVDTGA